MQLRDAAPCPSMKYDEFFGRSKEIGYLLAATDELRDIT